MESLAANVTTAMDEYDLQRSVRPFVHFIEDLTNWYIRRSRRRFWKSQDDEDKAQAYQTLNYVLLQLSKIAAPFVPFISESIYRNLRTPEMAESVHLCDFPRADGSNRDQDLESEMETVMTIVRLGRLLRTEHSLKVRQPLSVLHVVTRNSEAVEKLKRFSDIVLDELNVKELAFGDHETELAKLKTKADFRRLGPRFGSRMKQVAKAIADMDDDLMVRLSCGKSVEISLDGESISLDPEDVVIERIPKEGLVVASECELLVALETALTPNLILEGLAREFVSKIQNMRKTAGLDVTQRIRITFSGDDSLREAVEKLSDYVSTETLCVGAAYVDSEPAAATEWDLNGHQAFIRIDSETT